MKSTFTALIAIAALVSATVCGQQQQFVVGFLSNVTNPVPGYEVASVSDLQTAAFAAQYNSVGLSYLAPYAPSTVCCVLRVREGFLEFGPSASNANYLESYNNGADMCTSATQPLNTTFGVPSFFTTGPYIGLWIANLSAKEQGSLRATTVVPPGTEATCTYAVTSSNQFPAIYKSTSVPPPTTPVPTTALPPYIVQPQGPNFPAPANYVEMYVSDLSSSNFINYYNSIGGILLQGAVSLPNYCCMIRVADGGWVSYGPEGLISPLSTVLPVTGQWQCNQQSNNQVHWLATQFGGVQDNINFPTLNKTITSLFGFFVNNTQGWDVCNVPDSLTFLKLSNL